MVKMNNVFVRNIMAVLLAILGLSDGILYKVGGSDKCSDLSLRFFPFSSSQNRLIHILHEDAKGINPLMRCRVLSVKSDARTPGNSLTKHRFTHWYDQEANILKVYIPNNKPKPIQFYIELYYKGQNCVLSATAKKPQSTLIDWPKFKRKLLSLSPSSNMSAVHADLPLFSIWMVAIAIIVLVAVLAMCACHESRVEKTLSDEVGGTDFNQQVVGVSTLSRPEEENQIAAAAAANATSKRESKVEPAQSNATKRISSNISQQNTISVESTSRHGSNSSQMSTKIETNRASNPEPVEIQTRSQSTHEPMYSEPVHTAIFNQSETFVYKGNEGNIATPTLGRKQPVHLISRKSSDKKDKEKESTGIQKNKKSWLRRKSSKNKSNENQATNGEKKSSSSRHSDLPLPPTPNGQDTPVFTEDDYQYEAVETRKKRDPNPGHLTADLRQSSELYASIDEDKKRQSTGSHMYDIVETRAPPQPVVNNAGLEYAYTVVAPKDNPINPSQTSSGSGLYEVVSDDMKKNVPLVQVYDDYAVVQKDTSKKRVKSQQSRPLSDTDLAPTPPNLSGMPSLKKRTVSESELLQPSGNKPVALDIAKPEAISEHTYAKVNKQRKTSQKEKRYESNEEDSEEPPPIPPSLYAELLKKDETGETSEGRSLSKHSSEDISHSNATTKESRNSVSDVKLVNNITDEQHTKTSPLTHNPLYDEIYYV